MLMECVTLMSSTLQLLVQQDLRKFVVQTQDIIVSRRRIIFAQSLIFLNEFERAADNKSEEYVLCKQQVPTLNFLPNG